MALRVEGACNGCAQCCKTLGVPASSARVNEKAGTVSVPIDGASAVWMAFLKARGARLQEDWATIDYRTDVREPIVRIPYGSNKYDMLLVKHVCPQLNDDNSCKLHDTPEFPLVCKNYPTVLDDLSIVPECGYSIIDD